MTYILRPYQQEAVDRGLRFFRDPNRCNGIQVLPTGSGKSLVIANVVAGLDGPCLIFQPSREILEQNYEKFLSYGYKPGIYSASLGRKQVRDITLATIGSVKDYALFDDVRYVIVDECHYVNPKEGMYARLFDSLLGVRVLGFTATPYRLVTDGYGGSILKFLTRTRPRVFDEVVYYVNYRELYRDGYMARIEYHTIPFDKTRLRLNTTGAGYTDRSVQLHFAQVGFKNLLVKAVNRLLGIGRKNVLVFTQFTEESRHLTYNIPDSAVVTAETPAKERKRILEGFKAGRIRVVANVGVLTVGFDYPELETVVLARPSRSLALYYQMIGRGIRPHPDKSHCMVVDMVGLQDEFGKVEDLVLKLEGTQKWYLASGERPLTNRYFGERDKR